MTNRWAFLVGVNRYNDPNFGRLNFCVNDVLALGQILTQLGYTVSCLHDRLDRDDPKFPTRDNVEARLIELCQMVQPDDLLWVHFACHGTRVRREGNQKEPVLITNDTQLTLLKTRSLPVAQVEKIIRGSGARQLILTLDACHSGVDIGRGLTDPEFIQNVYDSAEGFALIAASTAQQKAFELREQQHGVFTYFLLQGLINITNPSGNFVTVNDLKNYVLNELRKWNVQQSLTQEPTARTEGLGDIILADYRQYPKPQWTGGEKTTQSDSDRSQNVTRNNPTSPKLTRTQMIQQQEWEEELASLTEQYTVVMKQRRETRDERDRLILQKQADGLLKEMEDIESKLKQLD
jgi:uncharacterized caspase-like protein